MTSNASKNRVYAVSSGRYSDYSVHFVCLNEKLAKECVEALNGKERYAEFQVEEMQVIQNLDELTPVRWYRVEVDLDGLEQRRYHNDQRPWEQWWKDGEGGWAPAGFAYGVSNRGYEQALKASRDNAAKRKARRAGVA